jgi:hypothetical protein
MEKSDSKGSTCDTIYRTFWKKQSSKIRNRCGGQGLGVGEAELTGQGHQGLFWELREFYVLLGQVYKV